MLRLVIREVIVDSKRVGGQVWVQLNWQTGAHEQFWYQRRVRSYAVFAGAQAIEQRVRELNAAGLMSSRTRCSIACAPRSEEHTSELQSHLNLVCRLLLEKKKKTDKRTYSRKRHN